MRSDLMRRTGRGRTEGVSRTPDAELFGMASEHEARGVLTPPWQADDRAERFARMVPLVQGGYYVLTGLWPLVHMESFERVTGKKRDDWLARTVGTLAAAIGGGLLQAGRRGYVPRELRTVAQLAAAGFISVEIPTVLRGRISPIYLADAAVELGFIAANAWAQQELSDTGEALDALVQEEAERTFG